MAVVLAVIATYALPAFSAPLEFEERALTRNGVVRRQPKLLKGFKTPKRPLPKTPKLLPEPPSEPLPKPLPKPPSEPLPEPVSKPQALPEPDPEPQPQPSKPSGPSPWENIANGAQAAGSVAGIVTSGIDTNIAQQQLALQQQEASQMAAQANATDVAEATVSSSDMPGTVTASAAPDTTPTSVAPEAYAQPSQPVALQSQAGMVSAVSRRKMEARGFGGLRLPSLSSFREIANTAESMGNVVTLSTGAEQQQYQVNPQEQQQQVSSQFATLQAAQPTQPASKNVQQQQAIQQQQALQQLRIGTTAFASG